MPWKECLTNLQQTDAKKARLYVQQMELLPETSPWLYKQFLNVFIQLTKYPETG